MSYSVEPVSTQAVLFGLSPLWDHRRAELVFTDCYAKSVSIFDPNSGQIISKSLKPLGEDVTWTGFPMPYSSCINKLLVSTSSGKLVEFDWEEEKITKILYELDNPQLNFEGGRCDSKGRLWTGTAQFEDMETLKAVVGVGEIHNFGPTPNTETLKGVRVGGNFDVPIALGWNSGETRLFWNDLTKRVVNVFDFDVDSGTVGNQKVLFDFKEHPLQLSDSSLPDGLCVDVWGNVYVACWKGGCVIKIDGGTGKLMDKIDLPVTNVTSLAFGGNSYESLYITTSSMNLDDSPVVGEPHAGKLFRLSNPKDNSFKGFQEHFINL